MNDANHITQNKSTFKINLPQKVVMEVNEQSYSYDELEVTSAMMWQSSIMPHVTQN